MQWWQDGKSSNRNMQAIICGNSRSSNHQGAAFMNINDAFPSKYIKSDDLQGEQIPVTMERVEMELVGMGRDQEHKAILYFKGRKKGLVLNATNKNIIKEKYGPDTDLWGGGKLILYTTETSFQGKIMMGLRVKHPPERLEQEFPEKRRQLVPNDEVIGVYDATPKEPPPSIFTEGKAMARSGIQSFRSWRDALSADEYEKLKPFNDELLKIANSVDEKGLGNG
jgi:hypothetical protein